METLPSLSSSHHLLLLPSEADTGASTSPTRTIRPKRTDFDTMDATVLSTAPTTAVSSVSVGSSAPPDNPQAPVTLPSSSAYTSAPVALDSDDTSSILRRSSGRK